MKFFSSLLPATKSLAGMLILFCIAASAQAASILSLSGTADDVKYEADAEVRLTLIDWSDANQLAAVETAYRQYQENSDLEELLEAVENVDTRGYLFSAAATGYRIKYAWKEEASNGQSMHFLVTPGLKTRNPYLWSTPNNNSKEFSFIQVEMNKDSGVSKTSLDGEVVFNSDGRLQLDDFDNISRFATLEDSTPYYLK